MDDHNARRATRKTQGGRVDGPDQGAPGHNAANTGDGVRIQPERRHSQNGGPSSGSVEAAPRGSGKGEEDRVASPGADLHGVLGGESEDGEGMGRPTAFPGRSSGRIGSTQARTGEQLPDELPDDYWGEYQSRIGQVRPLGADDDDARVRYPRLWRHLADTTCPSANTKTGRRVRKPSTLFLVLTPSGVSVTLTDDDTGFSLPVSCRHLAEWMDAVEAALRSPSAPWREREKSKASQKRRKRIEDGKDD